MTPVRETIARAIIKGLIEQPGHESEQPHIDSCGDYGNLSAVRVDGDCNLISAADAVLRALDEAGLVVVPKTMPDAVAWAICPIVQDEAGFVCKQCPATVEHNGKSGVMGCRGHCADIYRAMIAASVVE